MVSKYREQRYGAEMTPPEKLSALLRTHTNVVFLTSAGGAFTSSTGSPGKRALSFSSDQGGFTLTAAEARQLTQHGVSIPEAAFSPAKSAKTGLGGLV